MRKGNTVALSRRFNNRVGIHQITEAFMTKKIKRASCLCLTAVMGISLAASGAFAFADGKN